MFFDVLVITGGFKLELGKTCGVESSKHKNCISKYYIDLLPFHKVLNITCIICCVFQANTIAQREHIQEPITILKS